jgi:hypothetical protein
MIPYRRNTDTILKTENLIAELKEITIKNSFAESLLRFYDRTGFLTSKQLVSGRKLLNSELVGGKNVFDWSILVDGVYIDLDPNAVFPQLYKIAHLKNKYKIVKRVIRRRGINTPAWSTVVDNGYAHERIFNLFKDGDIRLLSFDEMVEIGRKTGLCCICGRALDDKKSIELGMGPTCAKRVKEFSNKIIGF